MHVWQVQPNHRTQDPGSSVEFKKIVNEDWGAYVGDLAQSLSAVHGSIGIRLTGFALDVADFSSMDGIWCISTHWFRISSRIEIILNSWHRTRRLKMLFFVFFLHFFACCKCCKFTCIYIISPFRQKYETQMSNTPRLRPVLVPRLATRVLQWSRSGKTSHQDRSMAA